LISRQKMLALYTSMIRCRRIAVEADRKDWTHARAKPNRAIGWEATLAGVTADLMDGDRVCATRTSPVQGVLDVLRADQASGSPPDESTNGFKNRKPGLDGAETRTGDDGFDRAYRAARALKTARNGKVAILLSQQADPAEAWHRRLQDVAGQNLPLLIVWHGNFSHRQISSTETPITTRMRMPAALVCGVPMITVDGNDVLAVYRVASESIFRARQRRGPTLIECVAVPAPPPNEDSAPHQRGLAPTLDPILSMETYLTKKRILTKTLKGQIDSVFFRELNDAPGMRLQ
jgi:TPP-dependent pyruvate/acetoin dehydrogenase alpha subunit